MSDAGLNIVIGADVRNAVSGLDQVNTSLTKTGGVVDETTKKLSALYAKLDEAKSRQSLLINPANIRAAQQEIDLISKEIDALGNNQGFKKLEDDAASLVKGANDAYSAIRKVAYILPGIGIAGIFNLAFEGISKLIETFDGASTGLDKQAAATKRADDAAKSLAKTLGELKTSGDIIANATGSVEGEISKLHALADAVLNVNLSYKERQNALDQINEATKGQSVALTLESASYEKLAGKINDYAQALIQAAVVKGFTEEISKQTIELNKQKDVLDVLKKKFDDAQKAQASFAPVTVQAGGRGGGTGTSQAALEQNKLAAATNLARDAFNKQHDSVFELANNIAKLNGDINNAVIAQLKLKPLSTPGVGTKEQQDQNLAYLEKAKTLVEELSKKDTSPLFKDFAESAEGALGKINFQIYQENLKKATETAAKGAITADTFSQYTAALQAAFGKQSNPNLKSNIDFQIDTSSQAVLGQKIQTVVGKLDKYAFIKLHFDTSSLAGDIEKLNTSLGNIIDKFKGELVSGIAEGIGTAIGNGGNVLTAAIGAIEEIIGDALERLGKALIAYGIAKQAVEVSFKSLNGYVAIAAGLAAVIAGAALKSTATGGVHAFADGGIITGPTLGLVGEAGPEVIFPLSKLNDFVKSNTQGAGEMYATVKIKGADQIISINRAQGFQGRV